MHKANEEWRDVIPFKESSGRQVACLNGIWDFRCEVDDQWTTIRVPGCYTDQREGKWAKEYWDAYGRPRSWTGKGATYRRSLEITEEMLNRPLEFRVDGCFQVYRVLLNGTEVGSKTDGYTPLVCRLNDAAVVGENTLEVVVASDNGPLSGGESTPSRGIWQDTFLISHAECFLDGNPAIQTRVKDGTISCVAHVTNSGGTDATLCLKVVVIDAMGIVVKQLEGVPQSLSAGQTAEITVSTEWTDSRHWYPHDPYLYTMRVLLQNERAEVIDQWEDRFGFREITWKGPHLYLNGRELFLRGHGEHYLGDLQGTQEYLSTWFAELKKRGVNFMRLHIYPRHRDLYRAADEAGFMLMGEPAFHFQVPEETESDRALACQHLGDMIDHLRNHPSIIMWSVSNELRWKGGGEKPWLVDHGRAKDKTRPVFSSDFSPFSTYGDLLGHHYETDKVFSEWEACGPDKPMIWDECGWVWPETRPLDNGSAGIEMTSQDYATGMYHDGHDEILNAMDFIREGSEFAGELHRVNAVVPWDLGYVFFRWQPYNRFRGITLDNPDPAAPGTQPQQVLPASSPLNIWDPSLPVLEPNPGFYLFEEDMKWVRFCGENKARSFFSGRTVTIGTPLFFYDDLRLADAVTCKVEARDGSLLTEKTQSLELVPGQMIRDVAWTFVMPKVNDATEIRLVREFSYRGEPGYRDERPGMLYPQLTNLGEVAIYDPDNRLKGCFASADNARVTVALIDQLPAELEAKIGKGHRVIQLLSANAAYAGAGTAVKLLNGPVYRVLQGIRQEELTFWRGGSVHGGMARPSGNGCVILAANRDGDTSALHEEYVGSGLKVVTSLRISESLETEPAALWLLKNLVDSAQAYQPSAKSVAMYGSSEWLAILTEAGVQATALDALDDLSGVDLLLADGTAPATALVNFAQAGGTVLVQGVSGSTGYPGVALVEPFLGERQHCVKAARSWTLRDTPTDGVEYYENVVIPQPFEPNYDPLLAGISNIDLAWGATPMFEKGVTAPNGSTLISNWRIDWSIPPFGGEYINVGKDIRRANWFLNRTPVLLRVNQGEGSMVFSQLDFRNGGEKGLRVLQQLLTNLGVALSEGARLPGNADRFDRSVEDAQRKRFAAAEAVTARLVPLDRLPEAFYGMTGSGGGEIPRILLILDKEMEPYHGALSASLKGVTRTSFASVDFSDVTQIPGNLRSTLGSCAWDVIYFTLGTEPGLNDDSLSAINATIHSLKATGAQLMWGSMLPKPAALANPGYNEAVVSFNRYVKKFLDGNDVYINDTHDFMTKQLQDYLLGDSGKPNQADREKVGGSIGAAIKFFGN